MIITCAVFSKLWLQMSGRSPNDILNEFVKKNLFIAGRKQSSMIKVLNKYIPVAAVFGGICIGLITIFADLLGAIGSGTGILLVVNIIYSYFEAYQAESGNISSKGAIEF